MADFLAPEQRSALMAAIRSRDNKHTELVLASLFRVHGIRGWRRHKRIKRRCRSRNPGSRSVRPDFVFGQGRLVVFVDGCFWHGCPKHYLAPTSNKSFWRSKLLDNRERDRITTYWLRRDGWKVVRIWHHQLLSPERVIRRIASILARRSVRIDPEGPRT
jgi:DNA mismatch endonuclease (patch repair protein)